MKVSSSMISTSVAISAASSRPESSTSSRKLRHVDIEHLGGVVLRQPLQRDQQERLARHRRDLGQMPFDRLVRRRGVAVLPLRATEFQILLKSR